MQEVSFIWLDGKFVPWHDAKVHVLTHTLHYGGGVFEGIRCYESIRGPAIFRLDDHIKRLYFSASVLDMHVPFSKLELKNAIISSIKMNNIKHGYIRPLIFYRYCGMQLHPSKNQVGVMIAAWPWGQYLGKEIVSVKTSHFKRIAPECFCPEAKMCGIYVNSILAILEVSKKGYDEALFLTSQDTVAEGSGENVFIVKDTTLITPPKGAILPGITRNSIFRIAEHHDLAVSEKEITLDEFYSADEAFFTGTAVEICAIGKLDDKAIGNGNIGYVTASLKKSYRDLVEGRLEQFNDWLTYIE